MVDIWHKTVFLLDHTFSMQESCGIMLDLDSTSRSSSSRSSHGQGSSQFCPSFIQPCSKSLWTCVVENTLEYSRILWDVFTDQRLIRILLSNPQSTETLNGWDKSHQNLPFIGESFAKAGPPLTNIGGVEIGIKSAIAALGEPSELQMRNMEKNKFGSKVTNKGRVVCFTSYTAESDLQDYFHSTLNQHNKTHSHSEDILPIQECEFVLVTVHPVGKERSTRITTSGFRDISSSLKAEVWPTGADLIYEKIVDLIMRHHDLVITSITGIPMKEEQNSTSSSNYDVPLFHPRMPTTSLDTTVLKWSAPSAQKGLNASPSTCSSACRITPVDVNSRPANCLSNFVLAGRTVWLDMVKKGKFISHVLTAHGGEMWMHILETSRNVLEDPPSISEGIGGRVTDYRIIPDFVEFMRQNTLVPYPSGSSGSKSKQRISIDQSDLEPVEMAKRRLFRKTAFWPLTISGSVLFSLSSYLDTVLTCMPKDILTDMERMDCEAKIFSLIAMEARGEPPPLPSSHHKKGKRDEQWRNVYSDLETFLKANLHSEMHQRVLECFLNVKSRDFESIDLKPDKKDVPMDLALNSMPILDSPLSPPPPPVKKIKTDESIIQNSGSKLSVLDLWKRKTEKTKGNIPLTIKLYPNKYNGTDEKGDRENTKVRS